MTDGSSFNDEADIGGAYSERDMVADDPWLDSDPYFSDERDELCRPEKRLYRNLENGRNLNNSFGQYEVDDWDHLHVDKGFNP